MGIIQAEDSVHLYNGVASNDIAVGAGLREFYMNFVSLSGGVQWQARTRVGSFQLRVIGTEGVSTITNEDFLVSKPGGSGGYKCDSNKLTVILTTECTVKFETNGGEDMPPIKAIYGEKLQEPPIPVREGYTFAGWYKDIHLTEPWNFEEDTVQGNMRLYAKWTEGEPEPPPVDEEPDDGCCCWWCWLIVLILILLLLYLLYRKYRRDKKKKTRESNLRKGQDASAD